MHFLECKSSEYECFRESFCLPQSYVCDGIKDCLYSADEWQCNTSKVGMYTKSAIYDYFFVTIGNRCRNGEIRLTGGRSPNEGLVEVCINGSFTALCLDGLDVIESTVVCRALNYSGGKDWINDCVVLPSVLYGNYSWSVGLFTERVWYCWQ